MGGDLDKNKHLYDVFLFILNNDLTKIHRATKVFLGKGGCVMDKTNTQKNVMPENPEMYWKTIKYFPYMQTLNTVVALIGELVPSGKILDVMCGCGFLIYMLAERNKELGFHGVDISPAYVEYAKGQCPNATFEVCDVTLWEPSVQYDAVLCTGALHHLLPDQQFPALQRMYAAVKPGGFMFFTEVVLSNSADQSAEKRSEAITTLGEHYTSVARINGAPPDVVSDTCRIMENDLAGREHKQSHKTVESYVRRLLTPKYDVIKTWPDYGGHKGYGEYVYTIRRGT